MELPFYLPFSFLLTALLSIWLLFKAVEYKRIVVFIVLTWTILQLVLGYLGFFEEAVSKMYRLPLLAGPPVLLIFIVLLLPSNASWLYSINQEKLTRIHIVRFLVELILYGLFLQSAIPEVMTFAGRNFDILAGLTAPIVIFMAYRKEIFKRKALLIWNLFSLLLLLNIVVTAVLAIPTPFQVFGFDQPNLAVLHFPFNLLPAVVVPIVLFAHIACIRQLWRSQNS
ncbi:MAG: hypothetical protein JXR19_05380 [Bacteroidia bacterium]